MPKVNRHGKATILSDADQARIRKHLKGAHRLIWDIAKFTGERYGAILKLQMSDVYDEAGSPREAITFRASTRKASPDGRRRTRQLPIHSQLQEILIAHKPKDFTWMFPSRSKPGEPITFQAADFALRQAIAKAGLESKGISTHSLRRTFITRLHAAGIDLYTIQQITGHQDLKALGHYVEISTDRVKGAIAVL